MNYTTKLYKPLEQLYSKCGFKDNFIDDNSYLKTAFVETSNLWTANFSQITTIKYLVIGEAPLWGNKKNYVYNPARANTQFFLENDLGKVLNIEIKDKVEFLQQCIQLGILFIETFPFALNKEKTKVSFQKMPEYEYRQLFQMTADHFFEERVTLLRQKTLQNVKLMFRYSRTSKFIGDLVKSYITRANVLSVSPNTTIQVISKQGGFVDRNILTNILTK